ncbi:MAG: chromate transporter [Phascolarctobacterium sp.]|nr:chromate transporter [Phascolarctobacterium sp.]
MITPIKKDRTFYWNLFKSTFLISAFTVGGGFVIVPLMKAKFVDGYHWLEEKESLDLVAIAQSAPGVVAVNTAIIMGYKLAGLQGALVTILGTVLPPLITLTIISSCYETLITNDYIKVVMKGLQCGATAVILDVSIDLIRKEIDKKLFIPCLIIIGTFIANYILKINVMYIILFDALIGFLFLKNPKYN